MEVVKPEQKRSLEVAIACLASNFLPRRIFVQAPHYFLMFDPLVQLQLSFRMLFKYSLRTVNSGKSFSQLPNLILIKQNISTVAKRIAVIFNYNNLKLI